MRKDLTISLSRMNYSISIARRFCRQDATSRSVEHLADRSVVRATGQDVLGYLQGLTTADMSQLKVKPLVYTMFLNSKGRILFDAFVHKRANCDESVFVDCHRDLSSKLLAHLNLFKVRRKIELIVDNDVQVFAGRVNDENGVDDPRTRLLGQRMLSSKTDSSSVGSYHTTRFNLGVAEGPDEIPPGTCFPLEYNLEWLNGVSFDKGCYIGQELTARTHHTGVVRKRIMPLTLSHSNVDISYGDPVIDLDSGKTVGTVRGVIDTKLLALMRVKETLASNCLQVRNVQATAFVPEWWPKEFNR